MKAYWGQFKDEEWGCVIVANTAKEAKVMFANGNPSGIDGFQNGNYLDIRINLRRDIQVPDVIKEPVLINWCYDGKWTCGFWSENESCDKCEYGEQKKKDWYCIDTSLGKESRND